MAVMLLPAVFNLLLSRFGPVSPRVVRFDQFTFFAGMAVYAGVLKWVGWNALTRYLPEATTEYQYLLFPAEIFCGLAVCCAWFYVRNCIALVLPMGFGMGELRLLKYIVPAIQLAAVFTAFQMTERVSVIAFLRARVIPWSMLFLFVASQFLAFRDVSCALHVQSSDPLCHVFVAKEYLRSGVGNSEVVYTSGFGAMNAVASVLAPLSWVQIIAIQHVLLNLLMFFLVTGTIGFALRRHVWALHFFAIPYLLLIPIFNLAPWTHYEGTPRQVAPALASAFCLLPVLVHPQRATSRYGMYTIVAMLEWLCVALNPACAPFVAILAPIALGIGCYRAAGAKQSVLRALIAQVCCVAGVGAMILLCDPFYHRVVTGAKRPNPYGQVIASKPVPFSTSDGVNQVRARSPILFENIWEKDSSDSDLFKKFLCASWLPAAVFGMLGLAFVLHVFLKSSTMHRDLLCGALAALAAWLAMLYAVTFVRGGLQLDGENLDVHTLRIYLALVLFRMQAVTLFFILAASVALLYVRLDRMPLRWKSMVLAGAAALVMSVLPLNTMRHFRQCAFTIENQGREGKIEHADIQLVEWIDQNLANENGILGLAGDAYFVGAEKHLYPYSGAQAVVLYGRMTNFCFFSVQQSERYGFDAYAQRVQSNFDAQWCLDNNIRWFYITRDMLKLRAPLDKAVQDGRLVAIQTFGESSVYKVVAK